MVPALGDEKLIQILKREGVSTKSIEEAIALSQRTRVRFSEALIELGIANERQVASYTAQLFGLPFVDVAEAKLAPGMTQLLPEKLARRYAAIALTLEENELTLVLSNPLLMEAVEEVTTLPELSLTSTVGGPGIVLPAAALPGWVVKTSCVATPGSTVNAALFAAVSVSPLVAVPVRMTPPSALV